MKRALDIVLVLLSAPLVVPIALLTSIVVVLDVGRPVLFRQTRPGLGGRPFEILKFRTMRDTTDQSGELLPEEQRLTRAGRLLRRLSLDELPELINVIKGEMSLVGPRPLLVDYLSLYTTRQARRHEVLPGITGWAQVNGRNAVSWEEKFELDVWYVENRSMWLDLAILARTLSLVVTGRGVSRPGHATVPRFRGQVP